MGEIGFKKYTWHDMSINLVDAKLMGQVKDQEMYFIDTDNFRIAEKPAKRTTLKSVVREALDRIKLAYCALKYGWSYFD